MSEHDRECERELTSPGYTPCRCDLRAGVCYCRKNPCECPPVARRDAVNNGNTFIFCDYVGLMGNGGCVRGAGHNGPHLFAENADYDPAFGPAVLQHPPMQRTK
jgi:hypothetical protein